VEANSECSGEIRRRNEKAKENLVGNRPQKNDGALRYEAIHRLDGGSSRPSRNAGKYLACRAHRSDDFSRIRLFARTPPAPAGQDTHPASGELGAKQPEWIVAEIVKPRVYTRARSRVEPHWIAEIGRHLCKVSYRTRLGMRQLASCKERLFRRLELTNRLVFGHINQAEATKYSSVRPCWRMISTTAPFSSTTASVKKLRLGHASAVSRLPDLDQAFFYSTPSTCRIFHRLRN
jgi:hypothetical protein